MKRQFELCDGRVVVEYDDETGELLGLCDWNGNDVSWHWEKVALETIQERMDYDSGT